MTKILFAADRYYKELGGSYEAIGSTAYNLRKSGNQVKLIYFHNGEIEKKLNLKKILNSFDLAHFFGAWTISHYKFLKACFATNTKVILTPMGAFEPWSLTQKSIKKKLAMFFYEKKILSKANLIHFTSKAKQENIKKINPKINTIFIPHGNSGTSYKKTMIEKRNTKKMLFFSRIHFKKGLDVLLKAWSEIRPNNWVLHVIGPDGDGSLAQSVEYVRENKLESNIIFKEPIFGFAKKKEIYKNYDVFVLPSRNENFALSILEALRHSLPVLTNVNVPWSQIKDYDAGWYIEDGYNELKKNLENIFKISDDELLRKSQNAYNLSKVFEWDEIIKDYNKMYQSFFK